MVSFRQLFEKESSTYSYLLWDNATREAILIDPVDITYERDMILIRELGLSLRYILDTHAHADHATWAALLKKATGAAIVISRASDALGADRVLDDGDEVIVWHIHLRAIGTPGHTNGCMSYYEPFLWVVFTGDALLIRGCGRTDLQGGSSERLYESIGRLYSLDETTIVAPGHDYHGRTVSTIGEEMHHNLRRKLTTTPQQFTETMDSLHLDVPARINEVLPINLHCGVKN